MEDKIKKILFKVILLMPLIWCLSSTDVKATHIVGGNLTYRHISGDLYEVKVVLRRDCFLGSPEADFDDPASVGIFTAGGSLAVWLGNNGQIKMPFMSSDTLNEFIRSDCGFEGTQVCVHETTYRGLVNLPDRPGGYYLAYQRCCRNGSLNNIIDPLETGGTYWTIVTEESLGLKNNSPVFKAWPDIYICANKPHEFDHSATDQDGDSLVYKLCTPSSGATKAFPKPQPPGFPPYDNVVWRSPYGLNDMMGGVPLKIDSKTGRITATPNLVGQFLIGICVDEYRNGVKIGTIRRDFQYNVRVCSQPPKAIFTTTETNCDGLSVAFTNKSLSASAFEWNFNYPSNDPIFKSTEVNPTFTFPSIGTYNVRLRATRGSDGCFDTIIQKVIIFNNKITPQFDFSLTDCNTSTDSIKILLNDRSTFDEAGYTLNNWEWLVTHNGVTKTYSGKTTVASVSNNGNISITLNVGANNGCKATLTKDINAADISPKSDFTIDYPACPVNDVLKVRFINRAKDLNPFAKVASTQWNIGSQSATGDTVIIDIPYSSDSISVSMKTAFEGSCNYTFTKKIKLLPPPMADFSISSQICSGLNINFKNNSSNTDTYLWNFKHPSSDPAFISTVKDPAISYIESGNYNVQLIASRSSDGCRDTILKEIGAFENKINANFNVLLTNCGLYQDSIGIKLTDVSATNQPGTNITLREWTVTQNNVAKKVTGANPEIYVALVGDISISLSVTASNGCNAVINKLVVADELIPKSDFTIDYPACPVNDVLKVRFINRAKELNPFAKVASTQWNINNSILPGDTVILDIPYTSDSISVILRTTFEGSCLNTITKKIKLLAPPTAQFDIAGDKCTGLNISFKNTSSSTDVYQWNFNHPSTDPTFTSTLKDPAYTFSASGKYNVQLIATRAADGCRDTIIKEIGAYENKIKSEFNILVTDCEKFQDSLTLQLTDLSQTNEIGHTITQREWTITQNGIIKKVTNTSPDINVATSGDVTIQLSVTSSNGCSADVSKTIKTDLLIPSTDFKAEVVGCPKKDTIFLKLVNQTAQKNPFAEIQSSSWTVGDKKYSGDSIVVSVPFLSAGIGVALETTFKGKCKKTLVKNIQVPAPVLAGFNIKSAECSGLNVSFENTSTGAISYEWYFNFPDTSAAFRSTSVNPSFVYTDEAVYRVMLRALRSDGCFDTITKSVPAFINNLNPDFQVKINGCDQPADKLKVTLTDKTIINPSASNKWDWIVTQNGNETRYSGNIVDILLSYTGDVMITLEVTSTNNCSARKTFPVKIADLIPEADFDIALVGCPTDEFAEFKIRNLAASLNPFARIDSTRWFVNGVNYSGDSIIVRLPANTNSVDVSSATHFSNECKIGLSKSLNLRNLFPKAAYQFKGLDCPTENTVHISLTYIDSLSRNVPLSSISWNATTGTNTQMLTGSPVALTIPKDSLVKLDYTATFANGCTDRVQTSFLPGPYASIKFQSDPLILCPGESKNLITNSNPSWTYTWSPLNGLDFADPKNPKVSVTANTTYHITVTDGLCSVNDSIQVIALSAGVDLSIDADNFTCDGVVILKGKGGIGNGTYAWSKSEDFKEVIGRGDVLNSTFTGKKQDFYVKFEGSSCSTKPAKITVTNEKPEIFRLSPVELCPSDSTNLITFNNNSAHNINFVWKSDPHIIRGGNTARPTVLIGATERDSFTLYYTATNQFNCTSIDSVKVKIAQNPTINFDVQLKECGKYEACFKLDRSNFKGFVEWDFGDINTNEDRSIDPAPCYTYKNPGTYNIKLINLISVCPFVPVNKSVTINPQVRLNPVRDTMICKGAELSFTGAANIQNVKYEWLDPSGKLLFEGQKYTSIYNNTTKIVLKASDNFNCFDVDTINVNVFEFNYKIEAKDSLCINEPAQLTVNIQNPAQYIFNWTPANQIISGGNTAAPVINASDTVTYKVVIRHISSGCIDSSTIRPKVTKPFVFSVKAPDLLCIDVPTEVNLTITNPNDYTYDWSPKDCVASGGNTINPKIKISKDKKLTVKVTNKVSGCSQTLDVNVKAADKVDVTIDAIPDFTIFEGKSVELIVKDPVSTSKYIWNTGSSTTSITVSPKETTTYTVTVTDKNGCTAQDDAVVTVRNAKCDETDVYLPNAFSPNNDGNNDVFRLRSNFIDEMELIIYNRWGQEVFRTKDDQQGWDGTFKGEELPPDAYAYFLRVVCINQGTYTKRGNVNLLR